MGERAKTRVIHLDQGAIAPTGRVSVAGRSHSQTPDAVHYIDNQVEHHRKFDYKTELLTMLRLHEIEYDEQYLWD